MRKLSLLILAIVLVFGTVAYAGIESELGMKMVKTMDGVGNTFEAYSSGVISRSEAIDRMNNYNAETTFILEEAVKEGASLEFIKMSAGLDMVIDLYRQGLDEMSLEKVKLANQITELVLIPSLEGRKLE